jgi:hypothetical protein
MRFAVTTSIHCLRKTSLGGEPMTDRDNPDDSARQLATLILNRHRGHLRELRIRRVEGGVVLHGVATSFYGKQIALHEVVRGSRFTVVANLIEVLDQKNPRTEQFAGHHTQAVGEFHRPQS